MNPRVLLATLLASCLWGCSSHYVQVTSPARELAEAGREEEALRWLDTAAAESSLDGLLLELDRGMLLHRAGRWEESAHRFNAAAQLADARETVRLGEEFFGRAPWRMGTLERQALHALNALNYLMLGQPESAAVEARLTDSLHLQSRREEEQRRKLERSLALAPFDEAFRTYLERLAVGRYISALAHELAGNEDSAFIDAADAWRIARAAPPGAPSHLEHLGPHLLREARRLGRPELPELEAQRAGGVQEEAEERLPAGTGEVVVFIEAGRIPERAIGGAMGQEGAYWTVRARPWRRAQAEVWLSGRSEPLQAETVTSLENLLLRRGALGALTDNEREASFQANAVLFASYFLLPPMGATLLIKRGYEVNTRMAQGWLTLPAEFQVVRTRAPAGAQTVRVRLGEAERVVPVHVIPGRPVPVVVRIE